MDKINNLSDQELRKALKDYDQNPGPITDSTRNLYRKKLLSLIENTGKSNSASFDKSRIPLPNQENDDDDTSDEDYNVQDDEETDYDDDSEDEDIDEDDVLEDDIKLSSTTNENFNSTKTSLLSLDRSPNRVSRGILVLLVSFFVGIFSFYLLSKNYQLKSITKQILILIAFSPLGYAIYRVVRYYQQRRRSEMQSVCKIVEEVLELLQSPDNPKGMMPILHIRDTILTPAGRKDAKLTKLWSKAVEFIEEHESRIKVDLVNVDGEDFRAWKWIGSRKL